MQKLIRRFSDYLTMIKFSHSLFALPFAALAVTEIIYYGQLDFDHLWQSVIGIIICMVAMRSAAMGFNRITDRHIDAKNPRTANRELPAGTISLQSAVFFVVVFLIIFVASAFWLNPLAGWLSPVAILITLGYSFTKRFTFLCHVMLGISLGIVPPAVWVALTGTVTVESILWMAGVTMYTAGFDILYATQDIDIDKAQKLHSIPARFGIERGFWIARSFHVVSLLSFIAAAFVANTGWFFALILFVVGCLYIFQHYLVRGGRLDRIPVAFFHVNASISTVVFFGILIDRFLLPIL